MGINEILNIGYHFFVLFIVFAFAYVLSKARFLKKFFLPASLIAGLILLIAGPQIAGQYFPEYALSGELYEVWKPLPALLINVVFACLFLASPQTSLKKIWKSSGPQVTYGLMVAWGHYMIGGLVTLFILIPFFKESPLMATLLEASFEGGHGTVAGLTGVYQNFDFTYGQEIANALATVSLLTAVIAGIIIINIGKRKGYIKYHSEKNTNQDQAMFSSLQYHGKRIRERLTFKFFIYHLIKIALAIIIGLLLHQLLIYVESLFGIHLLSYMPAYPFCMVGGLIVNYVCAKKKIHVSHTANDLISKITLSVLITTAIGTMSLDFINQGGTPSFVILYLAGSIWMFVSMALFARKMFKRYWFENMIVSFGQGMGMIAAGLLFAQIVDPNNKTKTVDAFGYKQLLFEPLMGGGVITALAIPILATVGLPMFTIICAIITAFWCLLGIFRFGRRKKA